MHYLHHSLKFFGQPIIKSRARGAPQFAHLSIKSQIGSPTIGLTSAVQNPQNTAQRSAARIGFNKTIKATIKSIAPIKNKSVPAVSAPAPANCEIQPIQAFFPCKAKTPCPINSPATAILNTYSISLVFIVFLFFRPILRNFLRLCFSFQMAVETYSSASVLYSPPLSPFAKGD